MKVAYLMSGVIGGLKGKNFEASDLSIRKKIIEYTSKSHSHLHQDNLEIDYYIYSWEPELKDTYNKFYNPKSIKCTDQIIFDMPSHFSNYSDNPRIQAHYSRWFGALEVSKLCMDSDIEYDLIVYARLDLCFEKDVNLKSFDPQKFNISRPINLNNYNWPKNIEMIDHIFISNPSYMFKFMSLYNKINEYTLPGQCPQWKLISSHFLSVWHLNKINLLHTDIITESNLTCWDNGYSENVDYNIFRFKNLTEKQLNL